ncbi:MAG: hypothetical protein V1913_13780, partial [Fibrobacterota bacterium]
PGITHLAWFGVVAYDPNDSDTVNDAITENTARINAAMLDDSGAPGRFGVLILPAGRFYTTGGHVIPCSLNLKGQGRGETLASGTANIQTLIIHRDNASNHICFKRIGPMGSACSNRWFAMDFSLMAEYGQTGADSAGLQVGDMNGFVIERVTFYGYSEGKALWFYNYNNWIEDWTLQDVSFDYNKAAVYFERRNIALPSLATSSGTGNKTISCTNHGRSAGDCVCLPSGSSGTFEIFYIVFIEGVSNANTFVVDNNLSNAITNAQGYYGGNNSFGFGKLRGVKIELRTDGDVGLHVCGTTPQAEVYFYGIFAQLHFWKWDRDIPTVHTKPVYADGANAHIFNCHFDIVTDGGTDEIFYTNAGGVIDHCSAHRQQSCAGDAKRLGFGTVDPQSTLHLRGEMLIDDDSPAGWQSGSEAKLSLGDTSSYLKNVWGDSLYLSSNNDVHIETTASNNHICLKPNGTGGVGVGTDTPCEELDVVGNIKASGYIDVNGPRIISGAGNPNTNSVVANPGSLYLNTNGGAGTTLYVKESGTGGTGWVAK